MLDLTAICGSMYEIKLLDGKVYKLRRPTQALYEKLMRVSEMAQDEGKIEGVMNETVSLLAQVLNRNTEGTEFTSEQLEDEYDFTIAMTVIGDYMKFYADEIQSRVNFPAAQ